MRPLVPALLCATLAVALAGCSGTEGDEETSVSGDVQPDDWYDEEQPAPADGGFVPAERDARSTFGLDVDTGSLGLARRLLAEGSPVPPDTVRPEEWVNGFPYGDPAPTDADLAVTAETGPSPTLDGAEVVRVAVTAREVAPEDRPRVHVTLVVDRSGSMASEERLGRVQDSLTVLADRLRPDDTVAVVSFEDEAVPLLPPTPVAEREAVVGTIDDLTPGGSTNLADGLLLGYDQARRSYDPDDVNLVVLCSDGIANVGLTEPEEITRRVADEAADGVHLVTVGFGMNGYNDRLMEQLADRGDGFYSYVDTFAEAERLFGSELTTTLVPVAEEARAQVAFDPGAVTSYRLVGHANRALADEDFDDLDVDAGELGAGHRATALYEVELADGVEPGDVLGTARVRWRTPGGESAHALADVVAADPDDEPSGDLQLATTVADLAQLLGQDPSYVDRGVDLDDLGDRARALLRREQPGADDLLRLVELARTPAW
ncbi:MULTISPECIES: vWA domain-containing protein [unclassified Nocardioides]|uniref:vWA domain-containing protein n=1 Tax=unclassified Nocardioides TaxID=2615069 RepID=UPI003015436C